MTARRLGVGFVGSGFNARFHMQSWTGVRDADVLGVWSPNRRRAEAAAGYARSLDVGAAKAYRSIAEMVADPAIDAIWLCGPNQARVENVEEIVDTIARGRGALRGLACEKPLARNVAEAREVLRLVKSVRLRHGYLENQVFAPQVERGRELLWARGAALTG
ncbi:MAG: Gfo/Idh/MocA family oxidoreductase, partial [Gemmatimonadota bacterium]